MRSARCPVHWTAGRSVSAPQRLWCVHRDDRSDGGCFWDWNGFWVAVERGTAAEHKSVAAMDLLIASHALALERTLISDDQVFAEVPCLHLVQAS